MPHRRATALASIVTTALTLSVAAPPAAAQSEGSDAPRASSATATPAQAEPGSELRVWLLTAGPGDAVWERYGHNAIRVLNTTTGRDLSYNWGIFDFQQVDFIPRFLQGQMLYMMAPFQSQAMIDAYAGMNREIVLQELALTPAQKLALRDFVEVNALPENRDYIYQYFRDNCSTRVRDLLDRVLDGALEARYGSVSSGTSYRFHTRRLTSVDPLIYTGMDALLGTPTDQEITVWEEMFIPMTLRDEIRDMVVTRPDGSEVPLVLSEEVAAEAARSPAPTEPPTWWFVYLALGLAMGGLFAASATDRVRTSTLLRRVIDGVAMLWLALGGTIGTILVLLLFTDHTFVYWNENIFLFNPLLLVLAVAVPLSAFGAAWRRRAAGLAAVVVALALVGLVWQIAPASVHQNAIFFLLALPAHLGLAWSLAARRDAAGAG